MSAKNKILTILSVLVTICSVFLVVSFLFVGILFLLPDQTKADKQLSIIQSEVQEIPFAIEDCILHSLITIFIEESSVFVI